MFCFVLRQQTGGDAKHASVIEIECIIYQIRLVAMHQRGNVMWRITSGSVNFCAPLPFTVCVAFLWSNAPKSKCSASTIIIINERSTKITSSSLFCVFLYIHSFELAYLIWYCIYFGGISRQWCTCVLISTIAYLLQSELSSGWLRREFPWRNHNFINFPTEHISTFSLLVIATWICTQSVLPSDPSDQPSPFPFPFQLPRYLNSR